MKGITSVVLKKKTESQPKSEYERSVQTKQERAKILGIDDA
jgi:hypothetical protein